MIIHFHQKFKKAYKKLVIHLQAITDKKLAIFIENPFFPLLNNHALTGKYAGYRSINITGDYRAIYKIITKNEVIFVMVGTHSQLYR